MCDKEFELPNIIYRKYARMTDILYCNLLEIVAAYNIQIAYQNKNDQINSKEQYETKKTKYIKYIRSFMDNAINAKEISYSTKSVIELNELLETSRNFGGGYQNYDLNADDRLLNLDINIRSFALWAADKQIPLPVEFYKFNKIEPPIIEKRTDGKTASVDEENTKVIDGLLKMVIAIAIDCYGYNPEDKKSSVTTDILNALVSCGLSLGETTIRKRLKEAAVLLPGKEKE